MHIPSHFIHKRFNDPYFDVVNPIAEVRKIFFEHSNLWDRIQSAKNANRSFSIGETGFGAGRTFLALLEMLDSSGCENISLVYNSVELYPMSSETMFELLHPFRPQVGDLVDVVVDVYQKLDVSTPGWKKIKITRKFGVIYLNLWIGEALEMIHRLESPCDAWWLDGHGPKKNPDMWRQELLHNIGEKTVAEGTCATFTVARSVRTFLTEAGFTIELIPGYGSDKPVISGLKK